MIDVPTDSEFRRGFRAFQAQEPRDAMYKTAEFLVRHFWGQPAPMANGLGVLLLTWNQAFYRYGPFDFEQLENCIASNQPALNSFRPRALLTSSPADDPAVRSLFRQFLDALKICEGIKKGVSSPVAVAKALHLLAPDFFPLWDARIAIAHRCRYGSHPTESYIRFMRLMKGWAERLQGAVDVQQEKKSLLKLIDEYNYARFTKDWVRPAGPQAKVGEAADCSAVRKQP
jgi:hypothetical protein